MLTIVVLFSRPYALDRVISNLERLDKPDDTNLLFVCDTISDDFFEARNAVQKLNFNNKLVVRYDVPTPYGRPFEEFETILRRQRIADIFNFSKYHLWDADNVLIIEDDSLYSPDALNKLIRLKKDSSAGAVTGYQPSRHNRPFLGVWKTDNLDSPSKIWSLLPDEDSSIDGCGTYFMLVDFELFNNHRFKPYGNVLGPDYNFGNYIKKQGRKILVDWSNPIPHATLEGSIPMKDFYRANIEKGNFSWKWSYSNNQIKE